MWGSTIIIRGVVVSLDTFNAFLQGVWPTFQKWKDEHKIQLPTSEGKEFDDWCNYKYHQHCKLMFSLGFHKRLGKKSAIQSCLSNSSLYEPALLPTIFELCSSQYPSIPLPRPNSENFLQFYHYAFHNFFKDEFNGLDFFQWACCSPLAHKQFVFGFELARFEVSIRRAVFLPDRTVSDLPDKVSPAKFNLYDKTILKLKEFGINFGKPRSIAMFQGCDRCS